MLTGIDKILILKTSIKFKKDLKKIAVIFQDDPRIKCWNVDRSDKDRVLRIEAENLTISEVVHILEQAGYYCEELKD